MNKLCITCYVSMSIAFCGGMLTPIIWSKYLPPSFLDPYFDKFLSLKRNLNLKQEK